jgi:hypothetical protein
MSAQFGLTIGLGLVGGFLGGPIGFSLGSIAGSVLGGLFFGPKQPNLKGPRLSDTRVQVSTYEIMIPIVHGAVRIAGNVVAMPEKGIEEVKKTEAAQTLTTFRYFATLELALCEAPSEMLAIWADSKLIYDTRSTVKLKKRYKKTKFRIRKGEETQLPDPVWEAEFGAGNVPAGRVLASVVIEGLPLEDFGNRIPNFTALVSRSANPVQDPIEHWSTTAAPTPTDNWLLDRPRSVLYNLGIAIPGDQRDYFIKYDAITGAYLSDSSAGDLDNIPVNGLQFDIDKNGFIYVAGDPNGSYGIGKQTMVRVDPSLRVVQVGIDSLIHIPYTGVGNPTGDVLVSDEAGIVYAIESGVFPAEIFGFNKTSLNDEVLLAVSGPVSHAIEEIWG